MEQTIHLLEKRCRSAAKSNAAIRKKVKRDLGRLLGQNTRAAGLFEVKPDEKGHAKISWKTITDRRDWATLSAGCYLLRSIDVLLPTQNGPTLPRRRITKPTVYQAILLHHTRPDPAHLAPTSRTLM